MISFLCWGVTQVKRYLTYKFSFFDKALIFIFVNLWKSIPCVAQILYSSSHNTQLQTKVLNAIHISAQLSIVPTIITNTATNRFAHRELNVMFGGKRIKYNLNPTYLGVTLDRSLTYRHHLTKTAHKIKYRNKIIHKLSGTNTWWAGGDTIKKWSVGFVLFGCGVLRPHMAQKPSHT